VELLRIFQAGFYVYFPKDMSELEPEQIGAAIRAFMAENCAACGVKKEMRKHLFCADCFKYLSLDLKERISDPKHYIETFHPAVAYIKERRFKQHASPDSSQGAARSQL